MSSLRDAITVQVFSGRPREAATARASEAGQTQPPPAVVGGRFCVEWSEPLGTGGFARVFRGRDIETWRPVAVKILEETPGMERASVRRHFMQEARILEALPHRHIVRVLDAGEEVDRPAWIALERLEGWRVGHWHRGCHDGSGS